MDADISSAMNVAGQAISVSMRGAEILLNVATDLGLRVLKIAGSSSKAFANNLLNGMKNRGGQKYIFKSAIFENGGAGVWSMPRLTDEQFKLFNTLTKKLHVPYEILSGDGAQDMIMVNQKHAPALESIFKQLNISPVKEDVVLDLENADLNKDGVVDQKEAITVIENALGDSSKENPTKEAEDLKLSSTVSEKTSEKQHRVLTGEALEVQINIDKLNHELDELSADLFYCDTGYSSTIVKNMDIVREKIKSEEDKLDSILENQNNQKEFDNSLERSDPRRLLSTKEEKEFSDAYLKRKEELTKKFEKGQSLVEQAKNATADMQKAGQEAAKDIGKSIGKGER